MGFSYPKKMYIGPRYILKLFSKQIRSEFLFIYYQLSVRLSIEQI